MEILKRTEKNKHTAESQELPTNSNSYLDEIEASLNNINHDFFQQEKEEVTFIETPAPPAPLDTAGLSLKEILESKYTEKMAPKAVAKPVSNFERKAQEKPKPVIVDEVDQEVHFRRAERVIEPEVTSAEVTPAMFDAPAIEPTHVMQPRAARLDALDHFVNVEPVGPASKAVEQGDIDDLLNKIRNYNIKEGSRTDADTRMDILRRMALDEDTPTETPNFEPVTTKRHNRALEELVDSIESDSDLTQTDLQKLEVAQEKVMFGESPIHVNEVKMEPTPPKVENIVPIMDAQPALSSKEANAMVDTLNLTNLALVEKTQELSLQLHEYEEDLEYMEGNLQRTNRLIIILLVLFVLLIIILGVYTVKTLL